MQCLLDLRQNNNKKIDMQMAARRDIGKSEHDSNRSNKCLLAK